MIRMFLPKSKLFFTPLSIYKIFPLITMWITLYCRIINSDLAGLKKTLNEKTRMAVRVIVKYEFVAQAFSILSQIEWVNC